MSARAVSVVLCFAAACGSSTAPPPTTTAIARTKPTGASSEEAEAIEQQRVEREEIVTKHRKLESAAQDALGATCGDPAAWAKLQCAPSCYPVEPRDPRAGKKLKGPVEIQHRICQRVLGNEELGPLTVMNELPGQLRAAPFRKRFPKPHKKGTWQQPVALWFKAEQPAKLPKRDVVIVKGDWREVRHPMTRDELRCVTISHYTRSVRNKLDACGGISKTTCEASGNPGVRAMNLLGYRLAEAKQLQQANNETGCRDAALQAVALARGLPRWRQYEKLNVGTWTEGLAYKTRFAGVLDEDQLFAAATVLGTEAQSLYAECGGPPNAPTTVEQEQSFHACP